MTPSPRAAGRVLLTGVPGWLTHALIASLSTTPPAGLTAVRCLIEPRHWSGGPAAAVAAPWPLEFAPGDLRDGPSLACALHGVDTVIHAAGVLHVARTWDWYEINTRGTARLVQAAVEAGVARFVFVSSNAAAGRSDRPERPLTEADPPRPLSHYGRSKWLAEQAVTAYQGRIETVVLRPCMFYGPPVPERHIEVYRRVLQGRMPLVGGGHFARSLTYIDNLVQACWLAATHPAASGQTYFISDRPVYTTRQVVEAMAAALGVPPRFLPLPRGVAPVAYRLDMALACAGLYWQTLHLVGEADWHVGVSCEKACRELGYAPTVELHEGMKRAVAWCRATGQLP